MNELKINDRVIDSSKNRGIITKIEDIHNIYVEFYCGGIGIYCQDEKCDMYDPLIKYE